MARNLKKLSNQGIDDLIFQAHQELLERYIHELRTGLRYWLFCECCFATTQHHYDGPRHVYVNDRAHKFTCLECGWENGVFYHEATCLVGSEVPRLELLWLEEKEDLDVSYDD